MGWFARKREEQDRQAFVQLAPRFVAFAGLSAMDSEFDITLYKWGCQTDHTQTPGGEHIKQALVYLVDAAKLLGDHWQRLHLTSFETVCQLTDAKQLPVPESVKAVIRLMMAEFQQARAMTQAAA
jgi:hypothetical protein